MATEMFELIDNESKCAVIKVFGVGGGGCNTVNQMVDIGIQGVQFICANTDVQHLEKSKADILLQIGNNLTRGLGAGADPAVGRQAAEEDRDRIREVLQGTDMLFITAGMGGGTGTGAAPVVAEIARELGILTLAVVTKPFPFEQPKRMRVAMQGIDNLQAHVDSLIVIPNEKLLSTLAKNITLKDAFKAANNVLQNAVQGISEIITTPGEINVDFADVRRVMSVQGKAMMGLGYAEGDNRAREAAELALASPLLEDIDLTGAQGILVNVTADENIGLIEYQTINDIITAVAGEDAEVITGTAVDPSLGRGVRVTVVATGLGKPKVAARAEPVNHGIGKVRDIGTVNLRPADLRPDQRLKDTAIGRRQEAAAFIATGTYGAMPSSEEMFDVPAFLRRQAN